VESLTRHDGVVVVDVVGVVAAVAAAVVVRTGGRGKKKRGRKEEEGEERRRGRGKKRERAGKTVGSQRGSRGNSPSIFQNDCAKCCPGTFVMTQYLL
jgi:hypothetical protein